MESKNNELQLKPAFEKIDAIQLSPMPYSVDEINEHLGDYKNLVVTEETRKKAKDAAAGIRKFKTECKNVHVDNKKTIKSVCKQARSLARDFIDNKENLLLEKNDAMYNAIAEAIDAVHDPLKARVDEIYNKREEKKKEEKLAAERKEFEIKNQINERVDGLNKKIINAATSSDLKVIIDDVEANPVTAIDGYMQFTELADSKIKSSLMQAKGKYQQLVANEKRLEEEKQRREAERSQRYDNLKMQFVMLWPDEVVPTPDTLSLEDLQEKINAETKRRLEESKKNEEAKKKLAAMEAEKAKQREEYNDAVQKYCEHFNTDVIPESLITSQLLRRIEKDKEDKAEAARIEHENAIKPIRQRVAEIINGSVNLDLPSTGNADADALLAEYKVGLKMYVESVINNINSKIK